jgi:hypothetical protein
MAVSLVSTGVTFPDSSTQITAATGFGFKNRIINGAMVIDQRNAGASVTINAASYTYTVDRWAALGQAADGVYTVQRSATAPAGFTNSLLATVTTADASIGASQYYVLKQAIEGLNVADLNLGTANAATVTLSFWVRSSLTGVFSGSITNSAYNRAYPFSYTINAANTWEQKTVTIAGDTTGTWLSDNGAGIIVYMDLGSGSANKGTANAWAGSGLVGVTGSVNLIGTSGATFYITGVQLEKGSTATSFDYRPYSAELALCQRYYIKINNPSGYNAHYGPLVGAYTSIRSLGVPYCLSVPMRVNGANFVIAFSNVSLYPINLSTSYAVTSIGSWSGDYSTPSIDIGVASGLTAGTSYILTILANGFISYSAEL